jgi:hypothetical protein
MNWSMRIKKMTWNEWRKKKKKREKGMDI